MSLLPQPELFLKCLVGSIYHYHTRLENQEVRVEILESGGQVREIKRANVLMEAAFKLGLETVLPLTIQSALG